MINSVYGAIDAQSYVSLEDAEQYMEDRYGGAAWAALDDDREPEEADRIRETLLVSASRLVDTLAFRYGRFFSLSRGFLKPQALKLPWAPHPYLYLRADGGTTTTIESSVLADSERFPGEVFVGGSVIVARGTNRFLAAAVIDSDSKAGYLEVSPAFDDPIDSTSEFYLLYPPDSALKHAVIEQAYHLLLANPNEESEELDSTDPVVETGLKSFTMSGVTMQFDREAFGRTPRVCRIARALLRPYLANTVNSWRG